MPTNFKQFEQQVLRIRKQLTDEELVLFQRKIVLEALQRIVLKTPVDTGHARLNWQVTIGVPAGVEIPGSGPNNIGQALSSLAALRPFQVVYISNPVPYIQVLEEGGFVPRDPGPSRDPRPGRLGRILVRGGYSVQAPRGMVSVTVAELLAIFR